MLRQSPGKRGSGMASGSLTLAIIGKRTKSGKSSGTSRGAAARLPTCSEALIKLAAAGVKVRERRENGVRTHCRRAGELFAAVAGQGGCPSLGLDLQLWAERAREWARNPPQDPGPPDAPVSRVFAFPIESAQTDSAAL